MRPRRGASPPPPRHCRRPGPAGPPRAARLRAEPPGCALSLRVGPSLSKGLVAGHQARSASHRQVSSAVSGTSSVTRWAGPGVALHVGLRQPVGQVGQVALGEHRVTRAPEQQGRDVAPARPALPPPRPAPPGSGWSGSSGMSATKSPTAPARGRRRTAGPGRRGPRAGSAGRDSAAAVRTKVGVRTQTRSRSGSRPGQPDQRRRRGGRVVVDRGVGQHQPGQPVRWPQRPAQRDRPAPVVGDGDHRARRCPAPAVSASEVVDPLGQPPDGAAAARTSPCRGGRPRPPASPAGRWPGTGATGRTRWGCRGRRAWSRRTARRRCPARARCGRRPSPSGAVSRARPAGPVNPAAQVRSPRPPTHQVISA